MPEWMLKVTQRRRIGPTKLCRVCVFSDRGIAVVAAPRTVSGGEVEGAGGAEGGTAADVAHRGHRRQHHPGRTLEISGYTRANPNSS